MPKEKHFAPGFQNKGGIHCCTNYHEFKLMIKLMSHIIKFYLSNQANKVKGQSFLKTWFRPASFPVKAS